MKILFKKNGIKLFLALCIFGSVLFGCTPSTDLKESVTIALLQFPKTIDPRLTTDATGQRLNQLIFNSLVKFDRNLTIAPDAATSWTYNSAKKQYIFHLKPDLTFSNGAPVTCEDIQFSFQEFQKDTSPFKSSFSVVDKVDCQKVEKFTVQLSMKDFSAVFLTDLTLLKIMPKSVVEKLGDSFGEHVVGSGPYEVTKFEFNEITLSRRKEFTNLPENPYAITHFVFKIIQDDGTRFLNAYKGAIDIIPMGIPLNKISYLKEKNLYDVITYPASSMNYLVLNFKNKELAKKEYRQAIAHSIDVNEIIKYKLEGFGEPATSILPPSNYFSNKKLKPIAYNPSEAKKFWKSLEKKNNIKPVLQLKTSNNPEAIEISKVLAEQFRKVGVDLQIQSYEWGTFYGDIKKGFFEIAMMRWVGIVDPDIYRLSFHSTEFPPGRNRGFYKNNELEADLLSGTAIENMEARKKHYDRIQEKILDDLAIIPLWYNVQVDLVKHRIQNYIPAQNGDFTPFLDIRIAD